MPSAPVQGSAYPGRAGTARPRQADRLRRLRLRRARFAPQRLRTEDQHACPRRTCGRSGPISSDGALVPAPVSDQGRPGALAAGAAFDQKISLGFPFGTTTEHVTIAELEPALRAPWAGEANGVQRGEV